MLFVYFAWTVSKTHQRLNAAERIQIESARVKRDEKEADSDSEAEAMDVDEGLESDSEDGTAAANTKRDKYMTTVEVQAQIQRIWVQEPFLCHCLFGGGSSQIPEAESYQKYFLQAIPVPPNRFRPPMKINGMSVEHAQTGYLSKIMLANAAVRDRLAVDNAAYAACIDLQTAVNVYMDSSKDPADALGNAANGIRQILERKEGLFRKNMMGKRVNHSCRSVISPDPYVGTNEIGLPRYFAQVLTYPTPVTTLNCTELRKAVERGPDQYPAARWVQVAGQRRVDLSKMNAHKRQAVAAQLLKGVKGGIPVTVGRQLRDGDYVLMNRQVSMCCCCPIRCLSRFVLLAAAATSREEITSHAPLRLRNDGL